MRKLGLQSIGLCVPIQLQTPRIEQPDIASSFALVESVLLNIFDHRTHVECLKPHRAVSPVAALADRRVRGASCEIQFALVLALWSGLRPGEPAAFALVNLRQPVYPPAPV
jgi:hypothetical protein